MFLCSQDILPCPLQNSHEGSSPGTQGSDTGPWPAYSPPCPNHIAATENAVGDLVKALSAKGGQTPERSLGMQWSIPGCLMLCRARCHALLSGWQLHGTLLLLRLEGRGCHVNAAEYQAEIKSKEIIRSLPLAM